MNKRNSYLMAGLVMTGILTVLIVMGIFWTPYDPNAMAAGPKLSPPSLAHLMGTDSFGRDIFSRVLKGAGTTYGIALCTVAIGAVCGTVLGAVTGYFGGIVDDVLMRLGDVLTAFPSILLALVVISLLGPGKTGNVILALSYLCIGVTPPDASLGYMLSESQGMFLSAPWYALGTGLILVWMIFGVGLIGEGLQRRNGGGI